MEEIIWSSWAVKDTKTIYQYIAMDSKYHANKWLDKINERVSLLLNHPQIGRVVPEKNNPNIRELLEGDYRIMYRVAAKHILIYRVMHMARNFK